MTDSGDDDDDDDDDDGLLSVEVGCEEDEEDVKTLKREEEGRP